MQITTRCAVRGEYTLTRRKADTLEVIEQCGPFDNLITDIGLDQICRSNDLPLVNFSYVGTGTATPVVGDIAMQNLVAASGSNTAATKTTQNFSPYRESCVLVYRYSVGAAAGNLTEVGVGWSSTGINALFSRARIVDSEGNPTSITVLSDEILDVTYTLYYYPPLTDSEVIIPVDVEGTIVNTTVTTRAAQISVGEVEARNGARNYSIRTYVADATIGPITGTIIGDQISSAVLELSTIPTYVVGSFLIKRRGTVPPEQFNATGGIGAILIIPGGSSTSNLPFQVQFRPPLPKTALRSMALSIVQQWGRYTP